MKTNKSITINTLIGKIKIPKGSPVEKAGSPVRIAYRVVGFESLNDWQKRYLKENYVEVQSFEVSE